MRADWANRITLAGAAVATAALTVMVLRWPTAGVLLLVAIIALSLLRRPRGTAIAATVLALFFPPTITFGLPTETVTALMLACSALAVLGVVQRTVMEPGSVKRAGAGMLGLIAAIVLASILTGTTGSIAIAVRPYLFALVMVWYLTNEARIDPAGFRRLLLTVAWVAAAVSILALVQRSIGTWPVLDDLAAGVQYTSRAYGGRPGGTMGHPILYGAVAALGALLALTQRGRLWAVAFLINTIGVLASGSRSALAAISIGLLVYVLSSYRRTLFQVRNLLIAFVAAAVASPFIIASAAVGSFFADLGSRLNLIGDVSSEARNLRAEVALERIFSSGQTIIVGHGGLSDAAYLTTYGFGDGQASTFDNMYLAIWHNYGLFGLLPLVALLVWLVVRGDGASRAVVLAFVTILMFVDIANWPALIMFGVLGAAMTPNTTAAHTMERRARRPSARTANSPVQQTQ
jgi:hypothetical protein